MSTSPRLTHPLRRIAGSCLLAVLMLHSAHAAERSGVFKNMEGQVSVIRDAKSVPAQPGAGLLEGDRIVTGPNSAASVVLGDGTVLSVGPNSTLELTHYVFDSKTQNGSLLLHLAQGAARMITGLMGKTNPDLVRLTTPTSTIGIRGTDFIVEATQ